MRRNKAYHDEQVQRKRVVQWYEKEKEEVENSEYSQVKLFAR